MVKIRRGEEQDLERLMEIERSNMKELVNQFRAQGWDEVACKSQIWQRLRKGDVIIFETGPEIIGYYYYGPTNADSCVSLDSIQVAASYRNQGYGTKLLEHFLQHVQQLDYSRAMLNVYPTNQAIHLYQRFGFQNVQETAEHILMERKL